MLSATPSMIQNDAAATDAANVVTVECDTGNEYDGRQGLRISAIFVIMISSMVGALLPVLLARAKRINVPPVAFFIAKYFGTGVIITTAIMHLLTPAFEALGSPCLDGLEISEYSWAGGICLMTIMVMFAIEIVISHFDLFSGGGHSHSVEAADPSANVLNAKKTRSTHSPSPSRDVEAGVADESKEQTPAANSGLPGLPGQDHLGHMREHTDDEGKFAAQMTGIFVLEFGIIFHSIFIGLTLAVAGEEFTILYIVLVFHQMFEGLGLGARLATAPWPKAKSYMPYLLAALFSFSTPIAIAAGLGVRATLAPSGTTTLIINGVFDSISSGILLYTGLVELLAHEFMFSEQMQKATLKTKMGAVLCVFLGAGLMALLAEWA